jgi:hypothetical protein
VVDLVIMGYALHIRCDWPARAEPTRTWVPAPLSRETVVSGLMFEVSTTALIGDGRKTFVLARSLDGRHLHPADSTGRRVLSRSAKGFAALGLCMTPPHQNQWIRDIAGLLSTLALSQYVLLWDRIQGVVLDDLPDKFV